MSQLGYVYPDHFINEMKINSAIRDRRIFIDEEIGRDSMFKTCYLLDRLVRIDEIENNGKPRDIEIVISSEGGIIYFGLQLISKIESLKEKGYKIITTVNSIAFSMGFMIALVGSHRRALRHARLMCHQPLSSTWGTLQEQIEDVEETKVLWNRMKELIIKYTSITDWQLEDIKKRKFDWFMWSDEAKRLHVIDEII